jgi:hypothetical protein
MSNRYNNGSHYENHRRAAEMHELAAHAHLVADEHSDKDHLSGHEQSRQALEHSHAAYVSSQGATVGHGVKAFGHKEIAALAHRLWEERGCPDGSAELDWHQAIEQLRSHAHSPSD